MSKIGYARVSSADQNLDRQLEKISNCIKFFTDKETGSSKNRPGLNEMLDYIRDGDIIVITELDRLSRNSIDLTKIMNEIQNKGATLEVLNLPSLNGIEDDNLRRLINNLILEIYKYQAESERKNIKERQAQGIKLAKDGKKYKGRKPLFTKDSPRLQHAFELYKNGYSDKEVQDLTGINHETFRRYRIKHNIQRNI